MYARAYGFQFQGIAASKAFLPPGGACLDVRHDRIEILLVLCAAGIPRGQDIKRFVARTKLPDIGQHLPDIIWLHQLIWMLEWTDAIPACSTPKRFLQWPDACYPNRNAWSLERRWEEKRIVKLVMLPGVAHRLARPELHQHIQSLV